MDCLVGVTHMLVFPVMRVCCAFVGLDNKQYKMHCTYIKVRIFCRNNTNMQNNVHILQVRFVWLVFTQYKNCSR